MYDGSSASHNGLNILNASTTTNSVTTVAPLTVSPHDCIGVSIAPSATVGIEPEKRTNIFHENRPLRATAACLTPPCTDMSNTGRSTRTPPLSKRPALMTQRALRYLCREQRRKDKKENPPRLISSNRVRSPDSGSISYTNHLDETFPARICPSERASELLTDCQYADSTSPLPRELPSPIVYPRTTPWTQRALRYSRREQRRKVAEGNSPRWKDPNCVRSPSLGSISYTHRLEQISPAQMTPSQRASQPPTDCNDGYSVRHTHLPRKPPSQTVHPRAAEVTRRTLRYLSYTTTRDRREKSFQSDRFKACTAHVRPCSPYESIHRHKKISGHNANV